MKRLILSLVAFNANLQLAHWQADTMVNTHRVLGDLYDDLTGLTDELAEVTMGKSGDRTFPVETILLTPDAPLKDLFAAGGQLLDQCRGLLKAGTDDDALNLLADMSGKLNRAKYLLKL